MITEKEDPYPLKNIIPAGAVVPGRDTLNIGLTDHILTRIEKLGQRQVELQDVYLFAPWKTIRRRREFQQNIKTLGLLSQRLTESRHADELRESNISVLPVENTTNVPSNQEADILILPLDNDPATENVFPVVDNG